MAAPIISGVLAVYLQEYPSLSMQELTQLLIDNSIKGALNFSRLESFGLDETTPNRLVQVKHGRFSMCKQACNELVQVYIYLRFDQVYQFNI